MTEYKNNTSFTFGFQSDPMSSHCPAKKKDDDVYLYPSIQKINALFAYCSLSSCCFLQSKDIFVWKCKLIFKQVGFLCVDNMYDVVSLNVIQNWILDNVQILFINILIEIYFDLFCLTSSSSGNDNKSYVYIIFVCELH